MINIVDMVEGLEKKEDEKILLIWMTRRSLVVNNKQFHNRVRSQWDDEERE